VCMLGCIRVLCGVGSSNSNCDGQTALMFAAMNRKDTIIRLLLNRGALPNMKVGCRHNRMCAC
jgi:ankyrin repeat protein